METDLELFDRLDRLGGFTGGMCISREGTGNSNGFLLTSISCGQKKSIIALGIFNGVASCPQDRGLKTVENSEGLAFGFSQLLTI
jgi:hypothetical protein